VVCSSNHIAASLAPCALCVLSSWVLCCCLQVLHGLCLQHLLLDGEDGDGGNAGMEACDDTGLFDGGGPSDNSPTWA
jgi:hypothetical protein